MGLIPMVLKRSYARTGEMPHYSNLPHPKSAIGMTSLADGKDQASYRPDIDGLRAISIILVVIFHAFPHLMPAGFVGVDIFFVISGFLISGIILRSLAKGGFKYSVFYSRRIKRIFPALTVALLASLVLGWMFLFSMEWKQLAKHIFAGAAFSSNLALMREEGYFNSGPKPLIHLWSLGIEEQFYIVWPLLLSYCWRRRALFLPSISAVTIASFILNISFIKAYPSGTFYFAGTRLWELAVGGLLAYVLLFRAPPRLYALISRPGSSGLLSLAGIVMLVACVVWVDEHAFPGIWALFPTSAAIFIIAAGPKTWFNRVILSSRLLVSIGLISYPLYLWHWPILFFAALLSPADIGGWTATVSVLVSVALSYLTYRLVELPCRRHRSAVALPTILASMLGVVGISGIVCYYKGYPRLHGTELDSVLAVAEDFKYPFGFNHGKRNSFTVGQLTGRRPGKVLFVGDSHAEQYYSRVEVLAAQGPDRFPTTVFATYGGCPPLPHVNRNTPGYACSEFFDYAMARATEPDVRTIVFSAYWEFYFGPRFGGLLKSEVHRINDGRRGTLSGSELASMEFGELSVLIERLRLDGKRVFIILSNPASELFDPKHMISRISGKIESKDVDRWSAAEAARPIVSMLRAAATRAGATVIDPVRYVCSERVCKTTGDLGLPLYIDGDHMRSSYVAKSAGFIDEIFSK
jgi:peptidoglycan/LPS O-acetylase OafA/YrhL